MLLQILCGDLNAKFNFYSFTVDEALFFADIESHPAMSQRTPGLQACTLMILSACSKLTGDERRALNYFDRARNFVDRSMRDEPCQHIVSALMIMILMPPSDVRHRQTLMYATLAHSLAELIPGMSVMVRFSSSALRFLQACINGEVIWPSAQASIGA